MKRFFTFLILASFILSSCVSSSNDRSNLPIKPITHQMKEEIPLDFFPKNYTIVSLGDSLTEGVGDSTDRGGYIPYLQGALENEKGILEAHFQNYGVKGLRTVQLLERLRLKEIQSALQNADMIILTIGGNDLMKVVRENFTNLTIDQFKQSEKDYEKNVRSVINTIRNYNSTALIVFVGLYNPFYFYFGFIEEMDQVVNSWNETTEMVLREFEGTFFVSVDDLFKIEGESVLHTDYFHPNDRGYEIIANEIFNTLKTEDGIESLYVLKGE